MLSLKEMRALLAFSVGLAVSAGLIPAHACSRCYDPPPLTVTARRADLVVVAVRVGDDRTIDGAPPYVFYAPFEVQETLRGAPSSSPIFVATRYGMCPDGVDVEPGDAALLFLDAHGGQYEPVGRGCDVRSLPVARDRVTVNDMTLSVETLAIELGLRPSPARVHAIPPRGRYLGLVCLMTTVGVASGFWLGRRRAR
jgi:hypothetical protein